MTDDDGIFSDLEKEFRTEEEKESETGVQEEAGQSRWENRVTPILGVVLLLAILACIGGLWLIGRSAPSTNRQGEELTSVGAQVDLTFEAGLIQIETENAPSATNTPPQIAPTANPAAASPAPTSIPSSPTPEPTPTPPYVDYGTSKYEWFEDEKNTARWVYVNELIEGTESDEGLLYCPDCTFDRFFLADLIVTLEGMVSDFEIDEQPHGYYRDAGKETGFATAIEAFCLDLGYCPDPEALDIRTDVHWGCDPASNPRRDYICPEKTVRFYEFAAVVTMFSNGTENFECGPFEGEYFNKTDLRRNDRNAGCIEDLVRDGNYQIGVRPDEINSTREATYRDLIILYRAFLARGGSIDV